MWYYHITSMENLPSILEHGLVPKIPSVDSAPQIPMIYLSNSIGRLLDLREQQLEESDKSGEYILLKVWLNNHYWILPDPDADQDCWMTPSKIPVNQITVLDE
jgi:hypothetical protein